MSYARVPGLALVAGLGLLVAVSGADAATAPAVTCGATLTTSATLSTDLVDCPGTALVIGADGITVDLGGHTISGTNAAGSEGIASDGHKDVSIVGGRITDFRINGVGIRGGSGNLVRGVAVRRWEEADVHPGSPGLADLGDSLVDRVLDAGPAGRLGERGDTVVDQVATGEPAVAPVRCRLAGVQLEREVEHLGAQGDRFGGLG